MSWINVTEVYYRIERDQGREAAVDVINTTRTAIDMELPTERRMIEAGRIKAANPIALADCFAISCAADNGAVLYTGDPEILSLPGLPCQLRDLRT
jgi:predicted nucleic acid-binding protein